MTLQELAELVEGAEGPSRELDAQIMFELYAEPVGQKSDGGPTGYIWPDDNPSWNLGLRFPGLSRDEIIAARKRNDGETLIIYRDGAPVLMNAIRISEFTASLDAAMSLVPVDHEWMVNWAGNSCASVGELPDGEPCLASAATPALALCAASLKALSKREGEDG